jgi:hypothetical protein
VIAHDSIQYNELTNSVKQKYHIVTYYGSPLASNTPFAFPNQIDQADSSPKITT